MGGYRKTDPATSVEAYLKTDTHAVRAAVVRTMIDMGGNATSSEVTRRLEDAGMFVRGQGAQTVTPRFAELSAAGVIALTGEKRKSEHSSRKQQVWEIVGMPNTDALEKFEEEFGEAGKPLSMLIRPAIAAPKGRTLVWGDWSAIEARILPWLADSPTAREVLDIFRGSDADPNAPDIYIREAAGIDAVDMGELWARYKAGDVAANESRQSGKVAVLSLGFGGAVGALQAMAAGYGMSLTDAEAERIVKMWRDNNPWARRFWNELWEAFQNAIESPGSVYQAGRVYFTYEPEHRKTVHMILPDGRPLSYPNCHYGEREVENEMGEIEIKKGFVYQRGDEKRGLWYGTLAENATQAAAGSRLREAITVLSPAPLLDGLGGEIAASAPGAIVGHTHDELVAECDEGREDATARWLYDEMMREPDWLEGCPMAAEISTNWYYTKAKGVAKSWHPA